MFVPAGLENVDRVRLGVAQQLLQEGDARTAREILEDVIANQPQSYPWEWEQDGTLLIRAWDLEEFMVESASREATHRGPVAWVPNVYGQAHYFLAFAHVQLREVEQAERVLLRALRDHGEHPRLHIEMAVVHAHRGEHGEAAERYCRALRMTEHSTDALRALALRGLGIQLAAMGHPREAQRALEMSLALEPDSRLAHAELAQLRQAQRVRAPTVECEAEEPDADVDPAALPLVEEWPGPVAAPSVRPGAVWHTGEGPRAEATSRPWWRRLLERLQHPFDDMAETA